MQAYGGPGVSGGGITFVGVGVGGSGCGVGGSGVDGEEVCVLNTNVDSADGRLRGWPLLSITTTFQKNAVLSSLKKPGF